MFILYVCLFYMYVYIIYVCFILLNKINIYCFVFTFINMANIFISFRELCDSKLSGLHAFDNMAIIH